MNNKTLGEYLRHHLAQHADRTWLRERHGDRFTDYSWHEACEQIFAVAAWLEKQLGEQVSNVALLSRNRPHWFLADLAAIVAGHVTVPLFTTLSEVHSKYILEFTEVKLLFLGETSNWDIVRGVLPDSVRIVTLPGVTCDLPHLLWDDIVTENRGNSVNHIADYDDIVSIAFTSGTTGVPKGALQTHRSFVSPVRRVQHKVSLPAHAKAFSYLPLAHIAERQLVEVFSVVYATEVTFNEALDTLVRDLHDATPDYLFGAPRVWEQLQQGVIAHFGSADDMRTALAANKEMIAAAIREKLGLQNARYLVSGAAPAPPSMLAWYEELGLPLVEGYGQTEAMGLIGGTAVENRIGSIGKPIEGVEIKIGDSDELLIRADGLSPGYYKRPEETAKLWQDGWLHTGDKARIDEDGFVFLSGRVKDYFKTIHGKFVAPAPIEGHFAACPFVEQLCLLGRGYSKTVMICVLAAAAAKEDQDSVEESIRQHVAEVNDTLYRHARIGAVMLSKESWTIDNGALTPTLKIRRDEVEAKFGEEAEALARRSAENHELLIAWV